jgi:hypothetical protein
MVRADLPTPGNGGEVESGTPGEGGKMTYHHHRRRPAYIPVKIEPGERMIRDHLDGEKRDIQTLDI